jgi:hypothetical protein
MKGEFRFAVQVDIQGHQSWAYRHWYVFARHRVLVSAFADEHRGCVTPKQIENLIDTCGGDTDLVDGYDEVPAEYQEKIEFALANGHIPDEDCTRVSLHLL